MQQIKFEKTEKKNENCDYLQSEIFKNQTDKQWQLELEQKNIKILKEKLFPGFAQSDV